MKSIVSQIEVGTKGRYANGQECTVVYLERRGDHPALDSFVTASKTFVPQVHNGDGHQNHGVAGLKFELAPKKLLVEVGLDDEGRSWSRVVPPGRIVAAASKVVEFDVPR